MTTARAPPAPLERYPRFAAWCKSQFGAAPVHVEVLDGVVYVEGGPAAAQLAPHVGPCAAADGTAFPLAAFGPVPSVPAADLAGLVAALATLAAVLLWELSPAGAWLTIGASVALSALVCVRLWGMSPAELLMAWMPLPLQTAARASARARTKKTA